MKQGYLKISALFLLVAVVLIACNTAADSKQAAEDSNDAKFSEKDTLSNSTSPVLEKDADFAVSAADGGRMEVELGNLAQRNAGSSSVKDFGMMMVQDHSKANDELRALAVQKGITLPDSLSNKKRKKYEELSSLKGNRFDEEYISFMVSDHKEDIELFQQYVNEGSNNDLLQWASGKISTLNRHLQHALKADSIINKSK